MGVIGYARTSTSEGRQVLDRQLDALGAVECERVFQDTASGADAARPGLVACLDHLRRNDVLVVLDLPCCSEVQRAKESLILPSLR